ncbi:SRR1-domain-containing protein [Mycena galericulata]|nr:SRR1-domain-containing protein [Mycena galericulata]
MTSNTDETGFKYSDFKPVVSRKKRKNRVQLERPSVLTLIERAGEELAKDDWIARCQQLLQDHLTAQFLSSSQLLCLGLGSPSSSPNSQAQLAFLLEICKAMGIEHANVSIYDPVFAEEDKTLFKQLGIRVLCENNEGRYPLKVPTILWMPHCDLDLYESILAANWSRERLPNPRQKLETRAPCLLRIEGLLECSLLPVSAGFTTAFNNIAIQSIAHNAKLPESLFSEIVEPPAATGEA